MSDQRQKVPIPAINQETRAFWDATTEGKLLLKKCEDCGEVHYYPRSICPFCMSSNTRWYESTGKGKVYSYSISRRAPVQYCLAYVTLDEGVTLMTNIIKMDLDDVRIDMDVRVCFVDTGDGCALPYFTCT